MPATTAVEPVLSGPAMFWIGLVIGAGFGIVTTWLTMTREQRARERAETDVADDREQHRAQLHRQIAATHEVRAGSRDRIRNSIDAARRANGLEPAPRLDRVSGPAWDRGA